MFNSCYKKEAMKDLENANNKYEEVYKSTMNDVIGLHNRRIAAVELIKEVENFINSLANTPKEFQKFLSEININKNKFEKEMNAVELESKNANKLSASVTGAGVVAGVGVAALGPTAAMAIATTFGTASTGTAIASLSGAAATNAALAWLGGGALVAQGGGMGAGEALLALAGPIGWAIGGVAIVSGGLLASSKNKQIAEKAESKTRTIKTETNKILQIQSKVKSIHIQIIEMSEQLDLLLSKIMKSRIIDYRKCSKNQLNQLKILLNVTLSLSTKLCEKVN